VGVNFPIARQGVDCSLTALGYLGTSGRHVMRTRLLAAAWALVLACLPAACGGSPQTQQPAPTEPTPSPTQPATSNKPPHATVVFPEGPACASVPCNLAVRANAYDTDGDTLTYEWSGCAAGTSAQAVCLVNQEGTTVATVAVGDGHGNTVTASATAQGTKRVPYVQLTNFLGFSTESVSLEALGNIIDPDEGLLCGEGSSTTGCRYVDSVVVSGDCRPTYALSCYCLGGLELDIYRTASSGTCTVTMNVKNSKGVAGTSIFTVPYSRAMGPAAVAR
jgi:hypothetical protein